MYLIAKAIYAIRNCDNLEIQKHLERKYDTFLATNFIQWVKDNFLKYSDLLAVEYMQRYGVNNVKVDKNLTISKSFKGKFPIASFSWLKTQEVHLKHVEVLPVSPSMFLGSPTGYQNAFLYYSSGVASYVEGIVIGNDIQPHAWIKIGDNYYDPTFQEFDTINYTYYAVLELKKIQLCKMPQGILTLLQKFQHDQSIDTFFWKQVLNKKINLKYDVIPTVSEQLHMYLDKLIIEGFIDKKYKLTEKGKNFLDFITKRF